MNKIYTLLFCLFTIISTAQNENNSKTLEVVGFAKIAISPDIGILNININEIDLQFSQSIKGLNNKSKDITNQLKKIGFEGKAIRTENFDVRKNTVYRNNESIDSGYVAKQQIQLEFKNNQNNITKILDEFSNSNTEFNLNFDFKLSDSLKESAQKQIIKLATENAFSKAKLISEAAKIEIEKISKINYGNTFNAGMRIQNNSLASVENSMDRMNSKSIGFTPSDIIYTDNILVIWDLK